MTPLAAPLTAGTVRSSLDDGMSLFVAAIKSPVTRHYYEKRLGVFLARVGMDPPGFLTRASAEPAWAEKEALRYVLDLRGRVEAGEITAATLPNYLKPVRLFCEMNDVQLNWKKITRTYPKARMVADDRAPTLEEIRALASDSDLRVPPAVTIMASSGIRGGAWDGMVLRDIAPIVRENGKWVQVGKWWERLPVPGEVQAAVLTVYPRTDEEYFTFFTAEAFGLLQRYLIRRTEEGEKISAVSPVLLGHPRGYASTLRSGQRGPVALAPSGLRSLIQTRMRRLGIRKGKERRHEFQQLHGFRKFFNSRAAQAMKPLHVELCMGHSTGLSDNYYRVSWETILEDYLKAVPFLTVLEGGAPEGRQRMADLEKRLQEMEKERDQLRLENQGVMDAAIQRLFKPQIDEARELIGQLKDTLKSLERGVPGAGEVKSALRKGIPRVEEEVKKMEEMVRKGG